MAKKADRRADQQAQERERRHKALAHEVRVDILTYFINHSEGSPSAIAKALGVSVQVIDRHMKQLVRYGAAELVEERPTSKGSPEHIYRALVRPMLDDDAVERLSLPARGQFSRQCVESIFDDIEAAAAAGLFSTRSDWVLARMPIQLDAKGIEELQKLHRQTLEESMQIEARSNGRRAKSGEGATRVSTCQLCFMLPKE